MEDTPRLDRSHRSLAPKPQARERSRPFIIHVHHGDVKNRIFRLSIQKEAVLKGICVHIFTDFDPEIAKKQTAFAETRQLLKNTKDVKFGLSFCHSPVVTFISRCDLWQSDRNHLMGSFNGQVGLFNIIFFSGYG